MKKVATCDFQQCCISTSVDSDEPVQPPFELKIPKDVRPIAKQSLNIQATSKDSDQTALIEYQSE